MNQEGDYAVLLRHLIKVIDSRGGQEFEEEWMIYAEGVGIKLMRHFSSLGLLYQGTKLQFGPNLLLDFIDHGSITVLTRAALETALAFNFIFCEPDNDQERDFRFMCWDYAGFLDRQGFHTISIKGKQLKKEEANELDHLKQDIISHACFSRYSPKQQNRILNGMWRLFNTWTSIAINAGYSKDYAQSIYSYFSGYAHTSRLSVMQIVQANSKEDQRKLASACIGICCVIMANFLWGYVSLFPLANAAFKSDADAHDIAKMWREIGQEMGKDGGQLEKEN